MRHIGTLPDEIQATTFVNYALVRGITATAEHEEDGWAVWVHDEDTVPRARDELDAFRKNPTDPIYLEAAAQALQVRQEAERRLRESRKRLIDIRERWRRPIASQMPITFALAAACVCVTAAGEFGHDITENRVYGALEFIDPADYMRAMMFERETPSPFLDIRKGEVWRLVTPIFLHFTTMHLVCNTYLLIVLGGAFEMRLGSLRLFLFVLALALASNCVQAMAHPFFGGFSGVGYGLFGFVWMRSHYLPESGFYISGMNVAIMLIWFFVCLTGGAGPIANGAHWSGLVLGVIAGYAPRLLQRR